MEKMVLYKYIKKRKLRITKKIKYSLLKKEIDLWVYFLITTKKKNNIKSSINRLFFINSMRMLYKIINFRALKKKYLNNKNKDKNIIMFNCFYGNE